MDILLLTLTDDPFDPPGHGRYGGSHAFFFDLSRQFVRQGNNVTIVTRLNSPNKPSYQKLGPLCNLHRISVGPCQEIDHHSFGEMLNEMVAAINELVTNKQFHIVQTSNWLSGAAACLLMPGLAKRHAHHLLSLGRCRLDLGEEKSSSDGLRDKWEQTVFSSADALVCVTKEELQSLARLYPDVKPKAVTIIPYGIDPNRFFPRPSTSDDFLCRSSVRFKEGIADFN